MLAFGRVQRNISRLRSRQVGYKRRGERLERMGHLRASYCLASAGASFRAGSQTRTWSEICCHGRSVAYGRARMTCCSIALCVYERMDCVVFVRWGQRELCGGRAADERRGGRGARGGRWRYLGRGQKVELIFVVSLSQTSLVALFSVCLSVSVSVCLQLLGYISLYLYIRAKFFLRPDNPNRPPGSSLLASQQLLQNLQPHRPPQQRPEERDRRVHPTAPPFLKTIIQTPTRYGKKARTCTIFRPLTLEPGFQPQVYFFPIHFIPPPLASRPNFFQTNLDIHYTNRHEMATTPAPNPRASLLAGLRTGGVRSASGPMANVPHTAAPTGTFNIPRIIAPNQEDNFYPPEEEDELSNMMSQNLYIHNGRNRQAPLTAAVDGIPNRFQQQQQQHSMNMNGGMQFNPLMSPAMTQNQLQQVQLQLMQMELARMQVRP